MTRTTVLAAAAALTAAGCAGPEFPLVPVEGTVTQGGRPVPNVLVTFLADPDAGTKGPRAWAVTGPDGRYRLATDKTGVGAIVGRQRVTVAGVPAGPSPPASGPPPTPVHVPADYGDPWKTPLRADVPATGGTVDLDLPVAGPR